MPVILAVDDTHTVPSPDWSDAIYVAPRPHRILEQQLVQQLVAALSGDAAATAELGFDPTKRDLSVVAFLTEYSAMVMERLASGRRRSSEKKFEALRARIEALPILIWLDPTGQPEATSLAKVAEKHGGAVPMLEAPPGFATLEWRPVIAPHARERAALIRRFPLAQLANHELGARSDLAARERSRQAVLELTRGDPADTRALIAAEDRTVHLAPHESTATGADLDVRAGLPRGDLSFDTPWVLMFFQGRPITGLGYRDLELPVAGTIDSTSVEDFESWSRLSGSGASRMRAALRHAAMELARELTQSALGEGAATKLLGDVRALLLCHAVIEQGLGADLEKRLTGPKFFWPTIQGGEARLDELARTEKNLWVGRERFPEWARREGGGSDLDRPVLYVPVDASANATCSLLSSFGFSIFDVTAAAAGVQAERRGAGAEAPRLIGTPPHPLLRATLAELGVTLGEGEVEIVEGPTSSVTLALLGGVRDELEPSLACALKAVVRVESFDRASVESELTHALDAAGESLVRRASERFAELPDFVRENALRLLIARLGASPDIAPELATLPAFVDTAKGLHTLAELERKGRWQYTTLAPPFPPSSEPCLRLAMPEARALSARFQLVLADGAIERERKAETRRTATPLPVIQLSAEERVACVTTTRVLVDGVSGEVGVLAPGREMLRGIELLVTGRPLCRVPDGPSWPLVARVNDDSIEPDRFFEAPARRDAALGLTQRVRDVARGALMRTLSPPGTALAARWLDETKAGDFRVTGGLWLASSFPHAPTVRVYSELQAAPFVRPLEVRGLPQILPILPLEGDLLIRPEPGDRSNEDALSRLGAMSKAWEALGTLGQSVALALLADARSRGVSLPALEEHAWSLALLGLEAGPSAIRASDGREIGARELLDELRTRGALWLGDGRGFAEGEFPSAPPGFVLPDEDTPIRRVLEARLLPGSLRRIGGVRAKLPEIEAPASPASAAPTPAEEHSFWVALSNRLASVFSADVETNGDAPALAPLAGMLRAFALTGSPIRTVEAARHRRAIRYDRARKRLLVAIDHPAVRSTLARAAADPRTLAVLAAAAVAEVNRALTEVTDADERRVLAALLEET